MPYRKIPIKAEQIYHVFNRSVAKQPIFLTRRDYERAIEVLSFYRYKKPPLRFSFFKRLEQKTRIDFITNLETNGEKLVEILAYCIMPNHVHFLLKPFEDQSISAFMRNFQHSYSKYFNIKNQRTGSLFQSMFRAVRIESDEQLLHVSRYIHLNPVSSFIINIDSLTDFAWSSFKDYINLDDSLTTTNIILGYFKSNEEYKKFVFDQAGYQRELEQIKHLALE